MSSSSYDLVQGWRRLGRFGRAESQVIEDLADGDLAQHVYRSVGELDIQLTVRRAGRTVDVATTHVLVLEVAGD